jgi:hypothetical protein
VSSAASSAKKKETKNRVSKTVVKEDKKTSTVQKSVTYHLRQRKRLHDARQREKEEQREAEQLQGAGPLHARGYHDEQQSAQVLLHVHDEQEGLLLEQRQRDALRPYLTRPSTRLSSGGS